MLQQRRHQRQRRNGVSNVSRQRARKAFVVAGIVILLFIVAMKTLAYFGVGNSVKTEPVILHISESSVVNVSVEGGTLKHAENDMKLYPSDAVVTSPRNQALLSLLDGSAVRLDESTQVTIVKSSRGQIRSTLAINLEEGTIWMVTPTITTYSGAITRTIASAYITATVPSQSEFVMSPRSITVFSADGPGLSLRIAGNDNEVIVGEGQRFTLPAGNEAEEDLYSFRSPLDPQELQSPFVEESRAARFGLSHDTDTSGENAGSNGSGDVDDISLTVLSPEKDTTVDTETLEVSGKLGAGVDKIRINGYLAGINRTAGTFSLELALPDEDQVHIAIEGVDKDGVIVSEAIRTVTRNRTPPEPPTIVSPASGGERYATSSQEIEISGTAPRDAVGIVVNDYRLQLYKPGDSNWSYLASTKLNNFRNGENIYEVTAINRGGYRSEPVTITIILGEGVEGIVGTGASVGTVRPVTTETAEEALEPRNAPTQPGSIRVTAPAEGNEYTTTESEFVIEGTVSDLTQSVWVNGYRLQLYSPGSVTFNYIASVKLSTLHLGRNVYRITSRGDRGLILDEMEYVVTFTQ